MVRMLYEQHAVSCDLDSNSEGTVPSSCLSILLLIQLETESLLFLSWILEHCSAAIAESAVMAAVSVAPGLQCTWDLLFGSLGKLSLLVQAV